MYAGRTDGGQTPQHIAPFKRIEELHNSPFNFNKPTARDRMNEGKKPLTTIKSFSHRLMMSQNNKHGELHYT